MVGGVRSSHGIVTAGGHGDEGDGQRTDKGSAHDAHGRHRLVPPAGGPGAWTGVSGIRVAARNLVWAAKSPTTRATAPHTMARDAPVAVAVAFEITTLRVARARAREAMPSAPRFGKPMR